jgi:hypothetical protein
LSTKNTATAGNSTEGGADASTEADATTDAPIAATVADGAGGATDNGILPASEFEPSGAPVQIVPDVDPSHPAVDNDPRAATTFDQNRIDFNDPKLTGAEAVAQALASQAKGEDKEA